MCINLFESKPQNPTHSHEIEAKKTLCQRTRLRSVSMWTKMCYQLGSFDIDSIDFDSLCVCVFVWPIRIIQLIALTVRSVKAFCVSIDAWKHSLSPRNKHSESVVEARTLSLFENAHALRFISKLHYSHQTVLFLLFFSPRLHFSSSRQTHIVSRSGHGCSIGSQLLVGESIQQSIVHVTIPEYL